MPVLSKLPAGSGGGEPGISNGQGILKLNIFTQMDEPEKKDGIWIQTNHQYERVMVNQPTVSNYESGVWSQASIMPFNLDWNVIPVEYNGCIYIFNGYLNNNNCYYKWDGFTWTYIGNWITGNASTVVYNNELYLIGIFNTTESGGVYTSTADGFYKYTDESGPIKLNNLPLQTSYLGATVYNNKIYTILIHYNSTYHEQSYYIYSYNGSTWTQEKFLNTDYTSRIIGYNGNIHVFSKKHYIFNPNDKSLNIIGDLPISGIGSLAIYNNEIHCINGSDHYKYNGYAWTQVSTSPYNRNQQFIIGYKNALNLFYRSSEGGIHYQFRSPEKVYQPNTLIISKGNSNGGKYLTNIADTSVIQDDGTGAYRFPSGFDDVFYFADTAFDWNAPMYYGNGSQWIKFKN